MFNSAIPWTLACRVSLSLTISWSLFWFMSTESVVLSNPISVSATPFSFCLQFFPSIRVFSNELVVHIRWPKYWSFSISPSNEYLGLISFRMDWLDLLAVQGTLKSLLQHHNLKASISSVLSLLYGSTLTSTYDYQKTHSCDYMDLCQQNDVSAFNYAV